MRRYLPLTLILTLVGLLGYRLMTGYSGETSPLVGKGLPSLTLPSLDGGSPWRSADIAEPVFLVNFFAHWCLPCLAENEQLKNLSQEHRLPIYGIAWKDDPVKLNAWLKRHGSPYSEIALDAQGKGLIALGATGVPESFLVRDGKIVYHYAGALDEATVRQELLPLLTGENDAR